MRARKNCLGGGGASTIPHKKKKTHMVIIFLGGGGGAPTLAFPICIPNIAFDEHTVKSTRSLILHSDINLNNLELIIV